VSYSKKTGIITKSVRQRGSTKKIREAMNPSLTNLDAKIKSLKANESIVLRSTSGKGVTPSSQRHFRISTLNQLDWYTTEKMKEIRAFYLKKGYSEKGATREANAIASRWTAVEIIEDEYDEGEE
jgi:hypothetical protein